MTSPTSPVSKKRVEIAAKNGIYDAETAAVACRRAGLPFAPACALLEKESGGRNVYGHDAGGAMSGGGAVTPENWRQFRHLVVDEGHTSNGVGPCQLTYRGFFTDMEKQGLRPWVPLDNMTYGFGLLWSYYHASGSWVEAGARYNGAQAYGEDLAAKVERWRELFGKA